MKDRYEKFYGGPYADMAANALDDSRTSEATVARIAECLKTGHVPGSLTRVTPRSSEEADAEIMAACIEREALPPVPTPPPPWWDTTVDLGLRRAAYAAAGYPAIASAPVNFQAQSSLIEDLRPYRVCPVNRRVQKVRLCGPHDCLSNIAEPTLEGARELAELDCVGDFDILYRYYGAESSLLVLTSWSYAKRMRRRGGK